MQLSSWPRSRSAISPTPRLPMSYSKTARRRSCCRMRTRNSGSREFYTRVGLNERELEIMQVSIPKQHYYVVSKLGRRLVDLGLGKVALSWVGVNGREERQIVESVMDQFSYTWKAEWLRLKGLPQWAEYLVDIEQQNERREYSCV